MSNPFSGEFEIFYKANFQRLLRTAIRITGNYADSEELVDEAFVIYCKKSKELNINHPSAYVMAILSNLLGNYLKSQRREKYVFLPLDEMREIEDLHGLQRPLSDILPGALLSWEREILTYRYEKKYSFKEISEKLNLKEVSTPFIYIVSPNCKSVAFFLNFSSANINCRQCAFARRSLERVFMWIRCLSLSRTAKTSAARVVI